MDGWVKAGIDKIIIFSQEQGFKMKSSLHITICINVIICDDFLIFSCHFLRAMLPAPALYPCLGQGQCKCNLMTFAYTMTFHCTSVLV